MLQFSKCGGIGNILGKYIENLGNLMRNVFLSKPIGNLGEPHENFMRTHWEHEK
jgi:hypothetical protein